MKYVGVIVTFNRKALLMNNLEMLIRQKDQLDKVLIIDNHSTDGTQDLVMKEYGNRIGWIDYRYMEENTGGAGGFYYGVKFACELGADFIYLMDDDGKPYDCNTFSRIKAASVKFYKDTPLIFINSLVTSNGSMLSFGFWANVPIEKQMDLVTKQQLNHILYGKVNPFNGTLISKELVERIGLPRKEFFLSRDETDYMKRSQAVGALIATITDSVYCHPASKLVYKKIGNLSVQIYDDLDREYYFLRNSAYTYKSINKKKIYAFCLSRFVAIVLYENQKIARIKQIKEAVSDALHNKMGKRMS